MRQKLRQVLAAAAESGQRLREEVVAVENGSAEAGAVEVDHRDRQAHRCAHP